MYVSTKRWTLKASGPPSPLRHQKEKKKLTDILRCIEHVRAESHMQHCSSDVLVGIPSRGCSKYLRQYPWLCNFVLDSAALSEVIPKNHPLTVSKATYSTIQFNNQLPEICRCCTRIRAINFDWLWSGHDKTESLSGIRYWGQLWRNRAFEWKQRRRTRPKGRQRIVPSCSGSSSDRYHCVPRD